MLQHPGGSFVGKSFGTAGLVNSTIIMHAVSFLNSQELGNASPITFLHLKKVPFWCLCSRFEATISGRKF